MYYTRSYTVSLSKGSSNLLLLSPTRAQYLPWASSAFPLLLLFINPNYIHDAPNSIFLSYILSLFLKQTQGNLIFLIHLYRHTAMAPDQNRWATNVGKTTVLWLQVKQYIRGAEHTHKGDSKSRQHYG